MLQSEDLLELILGREVPVNLARVCKLWRGSRAIRTHAVDVLRSAADPNAAATLLLGEVRDDADIPSVLSAVAAVVPAEDVRKWYAVFKRFSFAPFAMGIMTADRKEVIDHLGYSWTRAMAELGALQSLRRGVESGSWCALRRLATACSSADFAQLDACPRDLRTWQWVLSEAERLRLPAHEVGELCARSAAAAARAGNVRMLDILLMYCPDRSMDARLLAAGSAHPEVLRLLEERGRRPALLSDAATAWLFEPTWSAEHVRRAVACLRPAMREDLLLFACTEEQLRALRSEGFAWPEQYTHSITRVLHHIDVKIRAQMLRFAIGDGCAWHPSTLSHGLTLFCPAVVQWMVQNGCPWTGQSLSVVCRYGAKMTEWAVRHGCPVPPDFPILAFSASVALQIVRAGILHVFTEEVMLGVCANGWWEVCREVLQAVGPTAWPVGGAALAAARGHHFGMVRWALERGCPWDDELHELLGPEMALALRDVHAPYARALDRLDAATFRDRGRVVCELVAEGLPVTPAISWIYPNLNVRISLGLDVARGAVLGDRPDVLEACHADVIRDGPYLAMRHLFILGLEAGSLRCLSWMLAQHAWCDVLSGVGRLRRCPPPRAVDWLVANVPGATGRWAAMVRDVWLAALRAGSIGTLQKLADGVGLPAGREDTLYVAAARTTPSLLWLSGRVPPPEPGRTAPCDAPQPGQWAAHISDRPYMLFFSARFQVPENIVCFASCRADLRFLTEQLGAPWPQGYARDLYQSGSWALLRCAIRLGCPWDSDTLDGPTRSLCGATLSMIKWMRGAGCPWHRVTTRHLLPPGRVTEQAVRAAIWAVKRGGCSWCPETISCQFDGTQEMFDKLIRAGCPYGAGGIQKLCEWGRVDELRRVPDARDAVSHDALMLAASHRFFDVVRWAREVGADVPAALAVIR